MKQDNYKALFSKISAEKAPNSVVIGIETGVITLHRKRNIIRCTSYAMAACVAVIAFIPAIISMSSAMIDSGFSSYFSVLVTDGGNLLGSWKELGMAMIESLPMLSVAAVIALFAGFLYSASKSFLYMKNIRTSQI